MPSNNEDDFKKSLAHTIRALAQNDELEVIFDSDKPFLSNQTLHLPTVNSYLSDQQRLLIRGQADSFSLRIAFHKPNTTEQDPLLNMIETIRYESLGSQNMAGVTENLNQLYRHNYQKDMENITKLQQALLWMLRQRYMPQTVPLDVKEILEIHQETIEDQCQTYLETLDTLLESQKDFLETAKQILKKLRFLETETTQYEGNDTNHPNPQEIENTTTEIEESHSTSPDTDSTEETLEESDSHESSETTGQEPSIETTQTPEQYCPPSSSTTSQDYKAYTTEFDNIIKAEELCDAEELNKLREILDQQLRPLQGIVTKLANRLQRRLQAIQNRGWNFDLEEGYLDTSRLARIVIDPTNALSFKQEHQVPFKDTILTLLIDNSGSMRGRPIIVAAMSADILSRTLERCGIKTEILGFTTHHWKGGSSRKSWEKTRAQATEPPGRLNDLMHIIYKSADVPIRRAKRNLGLMMKEGLLKENIDGEALLWAEQRLRYRPEQRRILMVISDGAPVDDSTLSSNAGDYLEKHLRQVIQKIENQSSIELTAIGIGHDVTRYFKRAVTLTEAEQLGGAITEKLENLFNIKNRF